MYMFDTDLCRLAKTSVASLHPVLVTDARCAPEDVMGIDLLLDLVEARVVAAPE